MSKSLLKLKGQKMLWRNERYWIDESPLETPFGKNTVGVVDENEGGVIAYFGALWRGQDYIERLLEDDE